MTSSQKYRVKAYVNFRVTAPFQKLTVLRGAIKKGAGERVQHFTSDVHSTPLPHNGGNHPWREAVEWRSPPKLWHWHSPALFYNSDRIIPCRFASLRTKLFNDNNKVATCICKGKIWKQSKKKRLPGWKDGPLMELSIQGARKIQTRDSHLKCRPLCCFYQTLLL